jgi:hypothetical protein
MQKVKVTKRQRKSLGRNAMVHASLVMGDTHDMSDRVYKGCPPVYQSFSPSPITPDQYRKVQRGIPFVRA